MAKYLKKFMRGAQIINKKIKKATTDSSPSTEGFSDEFGEDTFGEDNFGENQNKDYNNYDIGIQPSQKPESFHHFILENQYKDLERSIRGFKDLYNKDTNQWETKRKAEHCFTDEEAEDILRTAQSHLATDIKLSYVSKEAFPLLMDAIYQEIAFLFESIAEYRYGRYNTLNKEKDELIEVNFEKQYKMKLQNHKIFLELFTRIQANYSRAIQGQENKATHDSVNGQESLQPTGSDERMYRRYS